jgi:hypothetical protein
MLTNDLKYPRKYPIFYTVYKYINKKIPECIPCKVYADDTAILTIDSIVICRTHVSIKYVGYRPIFAQIWYLQNI